MNTPLPPNALLSKGSGLKAKNFELYLYTILIKSKWKKREKT
jgi:hypothetical protein